MTTQWLALALLSNIAVPGILGAEIKGLVHVDRVRPYLKKSNAHHQDGNYYHDNFKKTSNRKPPIVTGYVSTVVQQDILPELKKTSNPPEIAKTTLSGLKGTDEFKSSKFLTAIAKQFKLTGDFKYTKSRNRHERRRLKRAVKGPTLTKVLSEAGQWSFYLFYYYLHFLDDCPTLKQYITLDVLKQKVGRVCVGLGTARYCPDIQRKTTHPDCVVRTFALSVFESCCTAGITITTTPEPTSTTEDLSHLPPYRGECGRFLVRPRPKIVGGIPAAQCEFPWLVGLLKNGEFSCGGSLIDDKHVITAAHCVRERAQYSIEAGKYLLSNVNDLYLQTRRVVRTIVHENYTLGPQQQQFNDIAFLTLESPVILNECVSPVCLTSQDQVSPDLQACTVAGWGLNSSNIAEAEQPDRLYRVDLRVYGPGSCRATFRKNMMYVTEQMLCADNDGLGGKDACMGDSGGPLMCLQTDYWVMFGVISTGVGCGTAGEPGYYTALSHYRDWIDAQIVQDRVNFRNG